jgi:hypothetical protein
VDPKILDKKDGTFGHSRSTKEETTKLIIDQVFGESSSDPMSEAKDSLNEVGDMFVLLFLVFHRLFRFLGSAPDAPRPRNCSTLSRPKKSSTDSVGDLDLA